jgi:hypothetical protein
MLDHEMTPNEILNAISADLTGNALAHWQRMSLRDYWQHIHIVQAGLDDIAGRQRTIALDAQREGITSQGIWRRAKMTP